MSTSWPQQGAGTSRPNQHMGLEYKRTSHLGLAVHAYISDGFQEPSWHSEAAMNVSYDRAFMGFMGIDEGIKTILRVSN